MLLFWRVRYLDTGDGQFKDRDLYLDTDTLEPQVKAAVELCHELRESGHARRMLNYRHFFREELHSAAELAGLYERHGHVGDVYVDNYVEDENGKALTRQQVAVLLAGHPNVIAVPAGAKQHDIDYMLAEKKPLPLSEMSLPEGDLTILGYFVRDLRKMRMSVFFVEGPGRLTDARGKAPVLSTAVSDDELRSFVMVFRCLYMEGEPGGFLKAVGVFARAVGSHPVARWVESTAAEYRRELGEPPNQFPFCEEGPWPFTRKRLIDVFIYTQYAHQPDGRRTRQYQECLAQVGNQEPLLTWLFLTAMWTSGLHMHNAGVVIERFWTQYCALHELTPGIFPSVSTVNPGIGALEKKQDRRERILSKKAKDLARDLWAAEGRPAGGPEQFHEQATRRLKEALEQ